MKFSLTIVPIILGLSVVPAYTERDNGADPLEDIRRENGMLMTSAAMAAHDYQPKRLRHRQQVAEAQYRTAIRNMVAAEASRQGVPVNLALAVAKQESGFNPRAVSYQGARGVMQVMPGTARLLGFAGSTAQLHDPETNIRLGVMYLKQGLQEGGPSWAVRRYHGGPNPRMHGRKNQHYHRVVMAYAGMSKYEYRTDSSGWLVRDTTAVPWDATSLRSSS